MRTRLLSGLLTAVICISSALSGQTRRDEVNRAFQFSGIDNEQGRVILYRALHPDSGFGDPAWAEAVLLLADMYNQDGDVPSAVAWLRWGVRISPSMDLEQDVLDLFLPETIQQFEEARVIVGADTMPTANTSWVWSENPTGPARIRLDPPTPGTAAVLVVGWGGAAGQEVAVAPGTQRIEAVAPGFVTGAVSREALPGIVTVVTMTLEAEEDPTPPPIDVAQALADSLAAVAASVRAQVLDATRRLELMRAGSQLCGVAVELEPGLALTAYDVIRGAETGSIRALDADAVTSAVQIVAYDVPSNLAVVTTGVTGDGLQLAGAVAASDSIIGVGLVNCASGTTTTLPGAAWDGSGIGSLPLAETITNQQAGSPVFDDAGALIGVVDAFGSVVPHTRLAGLVDRARAARDAGEFQSVAEVAQREQHVYGTAQITSDTAGALVRITPLDAHQWPELAGEFALPHTFVGPTGRYAFELLLNGEVLDRAEVTVPPLRREQFALVVPAGGGFPIGIVIGAVAAGGGLACILSLCKGTPTDTTTTTTTGTIIVNFPVNR